MLEANKMTRRVLVVDDDRDTVTMLCTAIKLLGYEAVPAYGGAKALEEIRRQPPHLVLLDLMMPEIDGYEVLRWMRSQPEMKTLPVVVVTASQDRDLEPKLARFFVTKVVRKPASLDALEKMIVSEYLTAPLAG